MKIGRMLLISAAAAALATPAAANAATVLFDFTGDDGRSFTFTLEQGQTPDQAVSFGSATRIQFFDVPGTFTGLEGMSNIAFGTGFFGSLQVSALGGNTFGGPDLFDGSETNPQFNLGEFELIPTALTPAGAGGSLTISQVAAVPEPATWAMMLVGFGFAGMMLRRRRTAAKVNYAF